MAVLSLLLAAVVMTLASVADAYGSCAEAYCVSCPTSRKVCRECKGDSAASWAEPLGVYAGRDGKCRLCVDKDPHCNACNGRTGACHFCSPNYGVNKKGRCVRCSSKHCSSCGEDASKCKWCRPGYGVGLPTGKCVPCKVPGCDPKYCGTDASKCVQCKVGWRLRGEKCVKQTAGRGRGRLL